MKVKNIVFTILILGLALIGGTYAYFSWQTSVSQQTNITFTTTAGFSCAVDGGVILQMVLYWHQQIIVMDKMQLRELLK